MIINLIQLTVLLLITAEPTLCQLRGTFIDKRDGKEYTWVQIGNQKWMAENLNYYVSHGSACYQNEPENCETYGRLYDWEMAQLVCPDGWHLPSKDEWDKMCYIFGGFEIAGTELKSKEFMTDEFGITPPTNSSGFSVLPAGQFWSSRKFGGIGRSASFWTSSIDTEWEKNKVFYVERQLGLHTGVNRGLMSKKDGYSVRCVKNYLISDILDTYASMNKAQPQDTWNIVRTGDSIWNDYHEMYDYYRRLEFRIDNRLNKTVALDPERYHLYSAYLKEFRELFYINSFTGGMGDGNGIVLYNYNTNELKTIGRGFSIIGYFKSGEYKNSLIITNYIWDDNVSPIIWPSLIDRDGITLLEFDSEDEYEVFLERYSSDIL